MSNHCSVNYSKLSFGIPDIELDCPSGQKINPATFAGHELIALFCPLDATASAQEIAAYRRHCAEFAARDAWLLTFAEHRGLSVDGAERVLIIPDPDRYAWVAFRNLAGHPEELDRDSGAMFLFTRGGGLHRYWPGSGHVDELMSELRTPSSEHSHQFTG